MYTYGPPHMPGQKQDDQLKYTFSSYVRIRDVALKSCQRRWTIGRSGERGSGISVLTARYDDDDDDDISASQLDLNYVDCILCKTCCPEYDTKMHCNHHHLQYGSTYYGHEVIWPELQTKKKSYTFP